MYPTSDPFRRRRHEAANGRLEENEYERAEFGRRLDRERGEPDPYDSRLRADDLYGGRPDYGYRDSRFNAEAGWRGEEGNWLHRPAEEFRSGNFSGRGPKNYRRSDDRIADEVNERLTRHPDVDASDVDVRVQEGEVILSGSVPHRHCKRLAEDIADGVFGVREVRNEIRIHAAPFSTAEAPPTVRGNVPQSRH